MFKSKLAIIALLSASLAACGPTPNYQNPIPQLDQATGQPLPQAQQQDGYGAGTVAAAAIGGALVGNMLGKRSAQPERTVIIDNRRPNYGYGKSYNRGYGKTVTTTTTRKSLFGNKTVTRTVTKRRR